MTSLLLLEARSPRDLWLWTLKYRFNCVNIHREVLEHLLQYKT